jgi:hypothetical protein
MEEVTQTVEEKSSSQRNDTQDESRMDFIQQKCSIRQEFYEEFNLDDYEMSDDERILVANLLNFELPAILTDDKLLFRKIFRNTKLSNDEIYRKRK